MLFNTIKVTVIANLSYLPFRRKLSPEDKLALQNEIDIMKQIDHPNIVKLHTIAEDEKYLYIVMELLQGGEVRGSRELIKIIAVWSNLDQRNL